MSETAEPVDEGGPDNEDPFSQMDPEMARCPQPVFREMRAAMRVVPMDGSVVLGGRAEVDEALRNAEVFSSNMSAVDLSNIRPLIPLQIDPPDHKKYRKILDPLFAPRKMAELAPPVTALVNDLIDAFGDRTEINFATDFSTLFPTQVFLTLLGLPLEDLPSFLEMKDGIIRPNHVVGAAYGTPEAVAHQRATADSIYRYFDGVLDDRQREPRDDLLSDFLVTDVEGTRLTRHEILDICFLFLIAGLDTVTATLDCMYAFLAENPDHRRQLVDNEPGVIDAAVEELLRWETPVMGIVRTALEDAEIGGCPIAKGDNVVALIGSANTDEQFMDDADVVRFDRESNRHIAFGGGIHRCLGSHLARLELRIALREWHRRIPEYAIADGIELEYTGGVRSIEDFPMTFAAPASK